MDREKVVPGEERTSIHRMSPWPIGMGELVSDFILISQGHAAEELRQQLMSKK